MPSLISCGKSNNIRYRFIIISIIFKIINVFLYGYNYNQNTFLELKIFSSDTQNLFSNHHLIHQIFHYMGIFLISFILDKNEKKYEKKNSIKEIKPYEDNPYKKKTRRSTHIILIHNISIAEEQDISEDLYKICLLISLIWFIEEQLLAFYVYVLKDLDFWMFELLIITFLSARMFKLTIYKHQKLAILFNLSPCILKIIAIYLSIKEDNILYAKYAVWIPIGILLYIILITARSYVNTKIKWLMDLKYISPPKLLKFYGVIGAIICIILCIITTFVKCQYIIKENTNKTFYDFICNVKDDKNSIYFDNFIIYFQTFNTSGIEIFKEVLIIIFGIISYFFSILFSILVIKYLTPVYVIFSNPIFFFLEKLLLILNTLIVKHSFFNDNKKIKITKFFLDISGDIISILGFLIYLEIIELNFNGYNYDLRKNIIERSSNESGKTPNDLITINEQDENDEQDIISNVSN